MTNCSNSFTIAFDSDTNIQSTLQNFENIIDTIGSPGTNIHGLATRRFLLTDSRLNLNFIRKIFSPINLWINYDNFHFVNPKLFDHVSNITFGSLADISTYNYHKKISGIKVEFNRNRQEIFVIKGQFRLRLATDCLDSYFVLNRQNNFILPLNKPVRCFEEIGERYPCRSFTYTEEVTSADLADTSVICLTVSSNVNQLRDFLVYELNLQCFQSVLSININRITSSQNYLLAAGNNFLTNYAWEMILSLGFYIKDRLTRSLMHRINQLAYKSKQESYPEHQFYRKMIAIYHIAKKNRFFNIEKEFFRIKPQWLPPMQLFYDYMPRIFLTPYGQYPRPLKPLRANRVLRQNDQFGSAMKHFCRVILRDCDMGSIQNDLIQSWRQPLRNILIGEGLSIGQCKFHFLLFSNSQLRDGSLCFYHQYKQNTVNHIHQWMGEFNHEKSVGTRIARMAQCFTSTTHGINLQSNQLICTSDLYDEKNRCFTDGCGQISSSLLQKLFDIVDRQEFSGKILPSVIQIRCGGLKGILVEAPDLQGDVIYYRKSQEKFKSNHLVIELINHSKPKPISFNQQVITLLEYMGVSISFFVEFQNECRKRLSMTLICKKSAVSLLRKTIRYYDWEQINQSGILIPQEPFCRSLLLTLCRDRLQRLRDKTHIPIPMSDGRMLYGVVDDTDSLEYGEVFIQISVETSDEEEEYHVICNTDVIVTRMPCHHPGDVRVLHAVDKPRLHYLKDCIVFPVKGSRPHSTEMAGGDYDGDEYWTCWNSKLIQQIRHVYKPAEYLSPEKPKIEGEHTIDMIVDFILDILANSGKVGVLSRRHLALCTQYSPEDPKALEIAQYISDSLDFPKTGINSITPEILQRLNVYLYPVFMQNKTKKTFPSNKAIAVLFRDVNDLHTYHSSHSTTVQPPVIDPDLVIDGYEEYIEQAKIEYSEYCNKMNVIMNTYDLNDETELITGCHFGTPEEPQNNDDAEIASQEFRALRIETKRIFEAKIDRNSTLEQERKASAWYFIAYSSDSSQRQCLSFPWTMHELLCEIKRKRTILPMVPSSLPHQSLEKIGKALIQASVRIPANRQDFVSEFVIQWMKRKFRYSRDRSIWIKEISKYCRSTEKFLSIQKSARSDASRIGEQFLILIDFLSATDINTQNLQPVAHECLLALHQIALTNEIICNRFTS